MRFSERIGAKKVELKILIEKTNEELRTALWNAIWNSSVVSEIWGRGNGSGGSYISESALPFWQKFWAEEKDERIHTMPRSAGEVLAQIQSEYFDQRNAWYKPYDFIQFLLDYYPFYGGEKSNFIRNCNSALEKKMSGYRIVADQVQQITDPNEISAIEEAGKRTEKGTYEIVNKHLFAAANYLSAKENPDFRNSIKESISAVEACCRIIAQDPAANLSDALKKIPGIHPALQLGFEKIYAYTSDKSGIRHALKLGDDDHCDFDEAKYMLVACSTFINYLIGKTAQ